MGWGDLLRILGLAVSPPLPDPNCLITVSLSHTCGRVPSCCLGQSATRASAICAHSLCTSPVLSCRWRFSVFELNIKLLPRSEPFLKSQPSPRYQSAWGRMSNADSFSLRSQWHVSGMPLPFLVLLSGFEKKGNRRGSVEERRVIDYSSVHQLRPTGWIWCNATALPIVSGASHSTVVLLFQATLWAVTSARKSTHKTCWVDGQQMQLPRVSFCTDHLERLAVALQNSSTTQNREDLSVS